MKIRDRVLNLNFQMQDNPQSEERELLTLVLQHILEHPLRVRNRKVGLINS